ncbi:Hypothetical protein, putative [Bodo saltans]|uniref:Laminin G domain-containing protein n=1 Tax=Bodo saltans TaxID=75058 RepID=A0A0S4JBR7_BODSA|nr:Hypothetical protein, putative [Bodo saltans]|eukprot:CUG87825.1 Hypothetical protein, putative [Bodo saltans]
MSLIIRLTDAPQPADAPAYGTKAPVEKGYRVTVDGQRAFFHDTSKEAPTHLREQPRLTEKHRGDVYITPCAGVLEAFKGASTEAEEQNDVVMRSFLGSIQERVAERQNISVVVRSTQTAAAMGSGDFFDSIAQAVTTAVSSSADRALQIVADEQAKERQMQRLLQSDEGESATQQSVAPKPPTMTRPATHSSAKKSALGMSPSAELRLRTMSGQRSRTANVVLSPRSSSARQRFTLLAASSESELFPPPSHCVAGLVPQSFIARPPDAAAPSIIARRHTVDVSGKDGKVAQRRQHQLAKRRATMAILEQLSQEDAQPVDPIKGNGWGAEVRYLAFNGNSSVLALPSIPKFEEFIKSFQIDFWLKTDCRMSDGRRNIFHVMEGQRAEVGMNFQIGLNFQTDFDEHIRIYIRDAGNRVMEVLAPLPSGFTTGHDFHHVMIRIRNIETGKVEVSIDGEPNDRLRYVQQEHPSAFNPWPHSRVYIGSYVDDSNHVQQCIRGGICELRLWKGNEAKPFQRWSLLGDRTVIAKTLESASEIRESIHHPPEVCPFFDGSLVLNMGTMGLMGEMLGCCGFEVRFKTSVVGRSMSLLGVTDSQHKMSEVGIVLNAEPVLSKERFRYHEHHITCFVVDSNGSCLSLLVRGTDRQHVMDGQWHTLQWKVIDSELNKVEVRIDGIAQDILLVYREGPTDFCTLNDYMCVGGHNVRNWKNRNPFYGCIKSVAVTIRGEPFATLPMNEGPGAAICQDHSGHHNHGLLVHADGGDAKRNEVNWVPCFDTVDDEKEKDATQVAASTVVIHKSNVVSIAAVRFGALFDQNGAIQESIVDLFTHRNLELNITDLHISGPQKRGWESWRVLPQEAWHVVESSGMLKEMIPQALRLNDKSGHMLLVLRIGDCHISLIDINGPIVPSHASFDCNMLKWKYAIAMNGTKGKREQMLNQMVVGLERMLVEVSAHPTITARLDPRNQKESPVAANDLVKTLAARGIPSSLALTVHGLLLNSEHASHLSIVYNVPKVCSEEEAASIAVVSRAIHNSALSRAAKLIQRNWRGHTARERVQGLEQQRKLRKQQVEEILSLRRANPLVQPKKNLRAILITAHEFITEALPAIHSFNVSELSDALKGQGYNVEHIKNPSRTAVNKAISSIEPDSSTFVYISGYGGAVRVRQAPMFSQYRLSTTLQEGHQRAALELEATLEFKKTAMLFFGDYQEALRQEAAKASKKQGKKAAPAKNAAAQAQQSRHVEENFRVAREELLKDETENRTLKLQKEYEHEVALIQKEIRQVINAAQDFEDNFCAKADAAPSNFFLPSECRTVEPLGQEVFHVEDMVFRALQRQLPPMGFQAIVAVDLVPLTPGACGVGLLASSTGHTFRFPYEPEQRHLLSWHLRKAMQGYMPKVAVKSKEAILQGAVETPDTQRDWRSLASYMAHKMVDSCRSKNGKEILSEVSRETSYTADLVPVRNVITTEGKERIRRELETRRSQATAVFAVDSLKVTSDMANEFKAFIQNVTINETAPLNTVLLTFLRYNQGIDGIKMDALAVEIDRCAPANNQEVTYQLTLSAQGVAIAFQSPNGDKQKIQQWINSVAARSISWKIPAAPFSTPRELEVERIEILFAVKVAGNQRKMKHFLKQRMMTPLPFSTIRFVSITMD